MTKILTVTSDSDYANAIFEQSEHTVESILLKMGEEYEQITEEIEENEITFKLKEFDGVTVTDEFINYLNSLSDYNGTKHNGIYIII